MNSEMDGYGTRILCCTQAEIYHPCLLVTAQKSENVVELVDNGVMPAAFTENLIEAVWCEKGYVYGLLLLHIRRKIICGLKYAEPSLLVLQHI